MSVTYYVALPFVRTEEGIAPGQAQEMPNEPADATVLRTFGQVPGNLDEL